MKRFLIIIACSVTVISLVGCQPEGASEIGDLYGRWKLLSVESSTPVNYSDTLYLAFQGDVYQYQPNWDYDWGVYQRRNDSIFLNALQYDKFHFLEMGIPGLKLNDGISFKLDELSRKRMQLSRNDTIWYFKKYIE